MKSTYPTARVIILYALFGGIIGGALVGSVISISSMWYGFFLIILMAMGYGFLIGLLPALITGTALAYGQFYRHKNSLPSAFGIDFLVTIILAMAVMFFLNNLMQQESIIFCLLIGLTGGVSAVLTGLFALPKKETQTEKFDSLSSETM